MSFMIIPLIPAKQYIEELRDYAGMSDTRIAELAGMHRTSVWKLRNGTHQTTTLEHGIKIANLHAQVFQKKKKNTA